ncbi:prolyl 4-hydroxylase [Talaromyces islandicus]|uniref:Prolyl 4-hydroxylase n=1 Tax=Talaromyces islandicus TaxID=28573 RepID=A0A0U1LTE4_TALIS|nr:prolyl 4-hydroxylase [Talaromyces islandicus]
MPALPSLSTILYWTCYLVPIYLFVIAPGLRTLFPGQPPAVFFDDDFYGPDELAPSSSSRNSASTSNDNIKPDDSVELNCADDAYRVHLFSRSPLIIYVEDFLSRPETDHLLSISENKYTPSSVFDGSSERIDISVRLSDRALLAPDDPVVQCLEARARSFQGWRPNLSIEPMWAQRYNVSGYYRHHYDWAGTAHATAGGGDRVSTFMVYVDANCTGGGTNFPRLRRPRGSQWCRFIECDDDLNKGVTFKPIKGNAIFWENLKADGTGHWETWHAALPVRSGSKVGLNIWSWYQRSFE